MPSKEELRLLINGVSGGGKSSVVKDLFATLNPVTESHNIQQRFWEMERLMENDKLRAAEVHAKVKQGLNVELFDFDKLRGIFAVKREPITVPIICVQSEEVARTIQSINGFVGRCVMIDGFSQLAAQSLTSLVTEYSKLKTNKHSFKCLPSAENTGAHPKPFYSKGRW